MGRHHTNSSGSNTATPTPTSGSQVDMWVGDFQRSSTNSRDPEEVGVAPGTTTGENGVNQYSSGSTSVDRALIQHLIHCESLLVVSPLNCCLCVQY